MIKLPFIKNNSEIPRKFLTLEINACNIKCLSFYKEDKILKIIGRGKENLEPGTVRNGIIADFNAVTDALKSAISSATADSGDKVQNVIIGVTSDLCQEAVTTAKITRGSIDEITDKEYVEYQKRIENSATTQTQTNYSKITGNNDVDFEIITSSIVYTKLDEHKVEELIGHKGQEIEMAVYTAFCQKHHIKTLQKLAKQLGLKIMAVSSNTFALLKALNKTGMEHLDFVSMEVGCDFTNVSVIFGGAIVNNLSLHIGKKQFVEEVSRIMGITVGEAGKLLDHYSQGNLSQGESAIIQNCLEEILELWLDGIELLFSDFDGVKTFAPIIYLYGEGSQIQEIEETLTKDPWTKGIPFKAPPQILSLSLENFDKIKNATGPSLSKEWLPAACLSFIYEELI